MKIHPLQNAVIRPDIDYAIRVYIDSDIIPRLSNLKDSPLAFDDILFLAEVGRLISASPYVASYLVEAYTSFKPTDLQIEIYKQFQQIIPKGNERSMLILACMALDIGPGDQTSQDDGCFITKMNSDTKNPPLSLINTLAVLPLQKITDSHLNGSIEKAELFIEALKASQKHRNKRNLFDTNINRRNKLLFLDSCDGDPLEGPAKVMIVVMSLVILPTIIALIVPIVFYAAECYTCGWWALHVTAAMGYSISVILGCLYALLKINTMINVRLSNVVMDMRQKLQPDHDIGDLERKAIINVLASTSPKKSIKLAEGFRKGFRIKCPCCFFKTNNVQSDSDLDRPLLPLYRPADAVETLGWDPLSESYCAPGEAITTNPIAGGLQEIDDSEYSAMSGDAVESLGWCPMSELCGAPGVTITSKPIANWPQIDNNSEFALMAP